MGIFKIYKRIVVYFLPVKIIIVMLLVAFFLIPIKILSIPEKEYGLYMYFKNHTNELQKNIPVYNYFFSVNFRHYIPVSNPVFKNDWKLLLQYQDQKNSTLNIESNFPFYRWQFSLMYGKFFINPFWNRILFLRENFSNVFIDFPHERKQKGLYFHLNSSIWMGIFYLEDHSKGFYIGEKNWIVFYDFFGKKWAYFHKIQNQDFSFLANLDGEKKQHQGYISFLYSHINELDFRLFVVRKLLWDYYNFFQDSYDFYTNSYAKENIKNIPPGYSYFSDMIFRFYFFHTNILNFTKGEISFQKYRIWIPFLERRIIYFQLGGNLYSRYWRKQKNTVSSWFSYYTEVLFRFKPFLYSLEVNGSPEKKYFNIIYKITRYDSKKNLILGILYQYYDLQSIAHTHEFVSFRLNREISLDNDYYTYFYRSFLLERTYLGILIQVIYQFSDFKLYLNYYYKKKLISSRFRNDQNWEGKIQVSF